MWYVKGVYYTDRWELLLCIKFYISKDRKGFISPIGSTSVSTNSPVFYKNVMHVLLRGTNRSIKTRPNGIGGRQIINCYLEFQEYFMWRWPGKIGVLSYKSFTFLNLCITWIYTKKTYEIVIEQQNNICYHQLHAVTKHEWTLWSIQTLLSACSKEWFLKPFSLHFLSNK